MTTFEIVIELDIVTQMKYTSFNYFQATLVLITILGFGVFEWLSANAQIAAILTIPLLPLVFFFRNTYEIKSDHLAFSTFGKTYKKIWLKDIEKIEESKTLFGQKFLKIFFSPYDYVNVKLGDKSDAFRKELEAAIQ